MFILQLVKIIRIKIKSLYIGYSLHYIHIRIFLKVKDNLSFYALHSNFLTQKTTECYKRVAHIRIKLLYKVSLFKRNYQMIRFVQFKQ